MRRIVHMLAIALICGTVFTGNAAGDPFDPTEFLKAQEFEDAKKREDVKHGYVALSGVVFRRFDTSAGSILVPRTSPGEIRASELALARCLPTLDQSELKIVPTPSGEESLPDQIKEMVHVILDVAQRKCGSSAARQGT